MRGARRRLVLLLRVMLMVVVRCGGLRGVVQHVHRGLVRGQGLLPRQHREHRLIEPGLPQPRRQPGTGLVHPAGRDRHSQQHGHDLRGPLGRHVPVRGQHHCGGVQHRPVGHRARVRSGRRFRERDRPAARAHPAREQVLGHLPDDLHVNDLRPPRTRRLSAIQNRLAVTAFRRRIRGLTLARVRIPLQPPPLMTGLPAPLAVLAALPLRLLPRPARFLRPDSLPRRRRPRIRAVHRQSALQLRQPQLQLSPQLPLRIQLPAEHRILGVLRLHHSPQP